jgi:cell division protein FtsQ
MIKKKTIFKILNIIVWAAIGSGVLVLLVSAVKKERAERCSNVLVEFNDKQSFRMLDEAEIISALFPDQKRNHPKGKAINFADIYSLEKQLEKNPWILDADLFFDQQHVLHIMVSQRTPVARLFTPEGNSVYMDNTFKVLPLKASDVISLPVFTNFYIHPAQASSADSVLMSRVVGLAEYISKDKFLKAQVEQININPDNSFELVTQVGDQAVLLGSRSDWENLFPKLQALYTRINNEDGWSKYSSIDLQFKDQVVCIKKQSIFEVVDSTTLPIDSLGVNPNAPIPHPIVTPTNLKIESKNKVNRQL